MLLEVLMQCSGIISDYLSTPERRFRYIQIVIISNFLVVLNVGIKRVDCMCNERSDYAFGPAMFQYNYPTVKELETLR